MEFRVGMYDLVSLKSMYDSRWGFNMRVEVVSDKVKIDLKENSSDRRLTVEDYVIDVDTLEVLSSYYPPSYVLYDLSKIITQYSIDREKFLGYLEQASLGCYSFRQVLEMSVETSSKLRILLGKEGGKLESSAIIREIDLMGKLRFLQKLEELGVVTKVVGPITFKDIIVMHQIAILLSKEEYFIAILKNPRLYNKLLEEFRIKFLFKVKGTPEQRIKEFLQYHRG